MRLSHDRVSVDGVDTIAGLQTADVRHAALVYKTNKLPSSLLGMQIVAVLLKIQLNSMQYPEI